MSSLASLRLDPREFPRDKWLGLSKNIALTSFIEVKA